MPPQPLTITLSEGDLEDLEKLANRPSTPQQIAQRARIVIFAAMGKNNMEIARALNFGFWILDFRLRVSLKKNLTLAPN